MIERVERLQPRALSGKYRSERPDEARTLARGEWPSQRAPEPARRACFQGASAYGTWSMRCSRSSVKYDGVSRHTPPTTA